jgi:ATP-dependent protease ClpP protease subunit
MIDIKKSVYALASVDGENATLTMYGDIYEKRPVDWWTDEPIEGDFILLDEFLDDLEEIRRCKSLTIRMNSYGGDANVANVIHNRLRELARDGMETVCIVDGVAMSGGSLIMCACDRVEVNPSSLIMIHNAWGFFYGGYNAAELLELAAQLDAFDKMQASIYERKTGLSQEQILGMMAETTYMTGAEAVEKGFADALLEDAETLAIAASQDGRSLYIGSRTFHLAPGMTAPAALKKIEPPEIWRERMIAALNKRKES